MAKETPRSTKESSTPALEAELAKGTDRRVAGGRARSAAVRACAANLEAAKHEAAGAKPAAAAAAGGGRSPFAAAALELPPRPPPLLREPRRAAAA